MLVEKVCVTCGKSFQVPHWRKDTAKACSHACAVSVRGKSRTKSSTSITTCRNCGIEFSVPNSHLGRRVYCSKSCAHNEEANRASSRRFTGSRNPMWKGGLTEHSGGYIYENASHHPFSSNGYVLQHRLVMERVLVDKNPKSKFLVRLGSNYFLSPSFTVHHRDFDKRNNDEDNLVVMSNASHARYHKSAILSKDEYWPNNRPLPEIKYNPKSKKHEQN